jgi:hypothetical protein
MRKHLFRIFLFFAAGIPCLFAQPALSGENLPVKSVVLFTNGVGYFSREGTVTGSGSVELRFDARDINDLLKSMVVRDLDGGNILGVDYASREPLERALKGFSIDLSGNPGFPDLINQARGENVEITADKRYEGIILGAEIRGVIQDDGQGPREIKEIYVNLFGSQGAQSIPLKSVSGLTFQNPRLRTELESALKLISENRNTEKKSVFISHNGQGRRRIQAGYIAETPVWKTSYRLVAGNSGKHLLQGWGIVENTTDEDWKGIRLELISGMPVSFAMDLYQPLFNPRPFVPYSVQRNLDSLAYDQGFRPELPPGAEAYAYAEESVEMEAAADRQLNKAVPAPANRLAEFKDIAQGVNAAAGGDAVGEFFRYAIENPVDLPRRRSAMIPILNEEIEGERLAIYNAAIHTKHPMNGLLLKNTSALNLMGGPITIYEDGVYAGDARMDNLAPGAERLVSYSLDLSTEVMNLTDSGPEEITSLRLERGILTVTRTYRRERTYTLINRGDASRAVLVEHPASPDWKLTAPASFAERTENLYRFRVQTPAGKNAQTELRVAEERTAEQRTALSNMANDTILFYTNQKNISPAVRAALETLGTMKNQLADITRRRQAAETQVSGIHREQERIRGNMANLDRTSALYQRYVSTLNDQENTLSALTAGLDKLRDQETEKKKSIDDYLAGLDVK